MSLVNETELQISDHPIDVLESLATYQNGPASADRRRHECLRCRQIL